MNEEATTSITNPDTNEESLQDKSKKKKYERRLHHFCPHVRGLSKRPIQKLLCSQIVRMKKGFIKSAAHLTK